jgi:hypothetical protein
MNNHSISNLEYMWVVCIYVHVGVNRLFHNWYAKQGRDSRCTFE